MRFFSSSYLAKNVGAILKHIESEPVRIQNQGKDVAVMLSPSEYARLRRQERQVYSTAELPAVLREAIAKAQPSALAATFNDEVE